MAETVNLARAAQILGVSQPTLRRRLARDYKGPARIKFAQKRGRDWHIPVSELQRHLSVKSADPWIVAGHTYAELSGDASVRLLRAAREYVKYTTRSVREAWPEEREGTIRELVDAAKAYDDLKAMTKLVEAMRKNSQALNA